MAASGCDVDLLETAREPGAARHGNFINYYTFNPPENRLRLIPRTLLQDVAPPHGGEHDHDDDGEVVLVLDVGCNSGDLTVALYKHLQVDRSSGSETHGRLHLLGCDLDEDLILRAVRSNPFPETISFIPLDITQDSTFRTQLEGYLGSFGRSTFDLCVCLAVTMWVHLNHGDAALLELLSRLASLCHRLLLEVQPWKCYRSAARRMRKLGRQDFEHFRELKIQGDMAKHATQYLEKQCGMKLVCCFGSTTWDRTLLLFSRDKGEGQRHL